MSDTIAQIAAVPSARSLQKSHTHLQQHIDEWTELGWYIVGYSTNRVEDGSVLHNFIWRKD